jgi:RNA 2',3'-cyclic 3'-phosphodiesterase
VFWVSLEDGRDEMTAIHGELGRRLNAAGIAIESRPFSPHLTLARVRDNEQRRARNVAQRLTDVQVPRIRWRVDQVTLYHSDLSGSAPRYEAVHHVPLRGSSDRRQE